MNLPRNVRRRKGSGNPGNPRTEMINAALCFVLFLVLIQDFNDLGGGYNYSLKA